MNVLEELLRASGQLDEASQFGPAAQFGPASPLGAGLAELSVYFEDVEVRVRSNSAQLLEQLSEYFGPALLAPTAQLSSTQVVVALQTGLPALALPFADWPRAPGKSGRKEAFAAFAAGRVVKKVRTGMHFYLDEAEAIAWGPCEQNGNQVINFIGAQVIAHFLRKGRVLCHAAAVYFQGRGVMIAAASGAGKSTLAMHLMARGAQFCSNDRLLIRSDTAGAQMVGVPKWPRVNPGTLLHNPALTELLPAARQQQLRELQPQELWQLEEKYDVPIPSVFGEGRVRFGGELQQLVLLDWQPGSAEPTRIERANLEQRPELLELLVKSAGPLVWHPAAAPEPELNREAYLQALAGVDVLLCTGAPDFEEVQQVLSQSEASA